MFLDLKDKYDQKFKGESIKRKRKRSNHCKKGNQVKKLKVLLNKCIKLSKNLVDASEVHDEMTPKGLETIVKPSQVAKYKLCKGRSICKVSPHFMTSKSKQEINPLVSDIGKRFLNCIVKFGHCHCHITSIDAFILAFAK